MAEETRTFNGEGPDGTIDRKLSRQLKQHGIYGSLKKSILNRAKKLIAFSKENLVSNSTARRASAKRCGKRNARLIQWQRRTKPRERRKEGPPS